MTEHWGLPLRRKPKPPEPAPATLEARLLRLSPKERERTWADITEALVTLVAAEYRKEARAAAAAVTGQRSVVRLMGAIRDSLPGAAARDFRLSLRAIAEAAKVV